MNRRLLTGPWALALCLGLLSYASCARSEADSPSSEERAPRVERGAERGAGGGMLGADSIMPSNEAEQLEDAPSASLLAQLETLHPGLSVGVPCLRDRACDSPLRCTAGECVFPAALTGAVEAADGEVIFVRAGEPYRALVELADDDAERMRGLMHRRVMAADFGMVFVFPDEQPRSFWMRNTLIPLDIIFVTADGVIDSIAREAEPQTLTSRPSRGPARYVVELAGGECERLGIEPGQQVRFVWRGQTPEGR